MKKEFNTDIVQDLRKKLNQHRVYKMVKDFSTLQIFMQHHIFSVWDFMSLLKFLQHKIAPATWPWVPLSSKTSRRFINSIVLEEESDIGLDDQEGNRSFASHFEMYLAAMSEVGADTATVEKFVSSIISGGFEKAAVSPDIPRASREFIQKTFSFVKTNQAHIVAAAFAMGRESIIPGMFRELLANMNITREKAPSFHYYLERHIHLDEDFHAPLSLRMLNELCEGNPVKISEAEDAACRAIEARIAFWDGVAAELDK